MAKKPTAIDAPRQDYRALSPIRHDGGLYLPGDLVDLTDDQADELVGIGAIDPAPFVPPAAPAPTA